MRPASSGCERPEKTIRRFCGPRSIQCPGAGCVTTSDASRPGRVSSALALPGCISLLVLLSRPCYSKRVGGDILGYDRSGGDPRSVPHLQRCDEGIVNAGPDVAADRRATL